MFTPLTQKLDRVLEMGIPGYDCIVLHKGECVYRHGGGYSDLAAKIPVSGKERFNLYSCSKPITCAAAMQLYEKGLFKLDDPLSRYLPEFASMQVQTPHGLRDASGPITIRHLFTMSAGFTYDLHSPMIEQCSKETNGRCPTRELVRYLSQEPLSFDPGESFRYSLCHDVLAVLVEVLSGMRFGEYVRKNIFDPLGMTHSTFLLPDEQLETLAPQYRFKLRAHQAIPCTKANEYKLGSCYESGGAGCISTVDDMALFAEAMRLGGKILKKETIDLMTQNQLNDTQLKDFWVTPYGYGLGLRCPRNDEVSDFGWDGAAGCYLAIDRKHEMTMFYAQHVLGTPVNMLHRGFLTAAQDVIQTYF